MWENIKTWGKRIGIVVTILWVIISIVWLRVAWQRAERAQAIATTIKQSEAIANERMRIQTRLEEEEARLERLRALQAKLQGVRREPSN